MKEKNSKSLQYYMRMLHRILGYLTVGMVIIYSLSGIVLVHRGNDMMKSSNLVESTISPGLSPDQLSKALKIKKFVLKEETDSKIIFADGEYDKLSGKVCYLQKEYIFPFNKFVSLHKTPCTQNPHIGVFSTIFGIILFFLAISSLFMFKTESPQFKKNMIYVVAGVVLTIILIIML